MKKYLSVCLAFLLLLSLSACTPGEEKAPGTLSPTVVRTFEEGENGDDHIWVAYYEMSDGTWKTDTHAYKYCLELSGKIPGTESVLEFTVLSNREGLTFDNALWASGISSISSDYFSPEEARIVRTNFYTLE